MENLYVMKKLEDTVKLLEGTITDMMKAKEKVTKLETTGVTDKLSDMLHELSSMKVKLSEQVSSLRFCVLELELPEVADFTGKIIDALERFDIHVPDYSKFFSAFQVLFNRIKDLQALDTQAAGRFMNHIKMGYYPTDLENISLIKRSLVFPENTINILDPCCGCGLALQKLAEGMKVLTYGVELDEIRVEEARKRLYRIGKGSFFHSRISSEAFHLLFLNPPYMVTYNPNGFNVRDEKKFLVEALSCLMQEGVLVYIIPYYRLTPDICRILCDNFRDLRIHRFTSKEFERFKQVAVIGVRKRKEDGSLQAAEMNKLALHPEKIPKLNSLEESCYAVPSKEKAVDIFKGAVFDVEELAEQFRNSKSISCLFQKNELDTMERRPLLPFTIGQIGLIGGSGLLNGLIECDNPHILKGRIIKETRQDVKESENSKGKKGTVSEMTETTVNKMVFNILTVDGMKTLA